jgi:nitroreductase
MRQISPDELLSTTRAVRRRLDLERPLDPGLIEECLVLALQAPTGGNRQRWAFVVATDPDQKAALADLYRRGFDRYRTGGIDGRGRKGTTPTAAQERVLDSAIYLRDHLHDVPALVIPCIAPRTDDRPIVEQASAFGSILPAVWSFMLAARARHLGTAWTTVHLMYEREAAAILNIPYDEMMQVALIPVAHLVGESLSPAPGRDVASVVHWNRWGGGHDM